jgi:hypothetical protein
VGASAGAVAGGSPSSWHPTAVQSTQPSHRPWKYAGGCPPAPGPSRACSISWRTVAPSSRYAAATTIRRAPTSAYAAASPGLGCGTVPPGTSYHAYAANGPRRPEHASTSAHHRA